MERFTGIIGILVVLTVCYLFSRDRNAIKPAFLLKVGNGKFDLVETMAP